LSVQLVDSALLYGRLQACLKPIFSDSANEPTARGTAIWHIAMPVVRAGHCFLSGDADAIPMAWIL